MDTSTAFPVPNFPVFPRSASAGIPLCCNICSSRPRFSDTSHLLTHIASKGHLSTYYKVKVKSSLDNQARLLIDEYDAWYATWGIEALMSERMHMKERKRLQKAGTTASASADTVNREDYGQYYGPPRQAFPIHVDPFLQPVEVKEEDSGVEHAGAYTLPAYGGVFDYPHLPWLPDHTAFRPFPRPLQDEEAGYGDVEDSRPLYGSPPRDMTPPRVMTHGAVRNADSLSYGTAEDVDADTEAPDNEYAKLKGVCWPGMDIFDSATPEMKRRRNQKKSTDVVDRLHAASLAIEATEIVYSARGFVEKERPITGFPHSDSSPMRPSPRPPPLPKPRRVSRKVPTRKVLAPRDANARPQRGRRTRTPSAVPMVKGTIAAANDVLDNLQTGKTKSKQPKRGRKPRVANTPTMTASLLQPTPMNLLTSGLEHSAFSETFLADRSGFQHHDSNSHLNQMDEWPSTTDIPQQPDSPTGGA